MSTEGFIKGATAVLGVAEKFITNDVIRGCVLGEYADGKPRSLPDALNGEFLSPQQKKKAKESRDKRKKKRKKNGTKKLQL